MNEELNGMIDDISEYENELVFDDNFDDEILYSDDEGVIYE